MEKESQPYRKEGLIWWCTGGSKTKTKGSGAGAYWYKTERILGLSLEQYKIIFQAEVYAIKACAVENLDRDYKSRVIQLARHNRVQLIWMPGDEGIVGNETADLRERTGSKHPFTGPEPACSI
jgi:hypothetical protein